MAVSFLALTDVDEIRSTLGVDDSDIDDALLTNRKLEDELEADLLTWLPSYQTLVSDGLSTTPTSEQKLSYLKLRLYSKYFLSAKVASSGMLSILQKQGDGANEAVRFNNMKMSELTDSLMNNANSLKEDIKLLIDSGYASTYSLFGSASPTFDPVTNT